MWHTHLGNHGGADGDLQHGQLAGEHAGQHVGDAKAGARVQVIHDEHGGMRGSSNDEGPAEFETLPAGICASSVSIVYYA